MPTTLPSLSPVTIISSRTDRWGLDPRLPPSHPGRCKLPGYGTSGITEHSPTILLCDQVVSTKLQNEARSFARIMHNPREVSRARSSSIQPPATHVFTKPGARELQPLVDRINISSGLEGADEMRHMYCN